MSQKPPSGAEASAPPRPSSRARGAAAEARARVILLARGYEILAQNFHCRGGELDFVAKRDGVLCFLEVRSRASTRLGRPQDSVRRRKQERLIRAAKHYLLTVDPPWPPCRFDVLGLYPGEEGAEQIELIEGAFEAL